MLDLERLAHAGECPEDAVKAILADIAAQGYVVVPRVPTEAICNALYDMEAATAFEGRCLNATEVWGAMIHAAEDGG